MLLAGDLIYLYSQKEISVAQALLDRAQENKGKKLLTNNCIVYWIQFIGRRKQGRETNSNTGWQN